MKSRPRDSDTSATRRRRSRTPLGSWSSRARPDVPINADGIGEQTLQMANFVPLTGRQPHWRHWHELFTLGLVRWRPAWVSTPEIPAVVPGLDLWSLIDCLIDVFMLAVVCCTCVVDSIFNHCILQTWWFPRLRQRPARRLWPSFCRTYNEGVGILDRSENLGRTE
jgi:hypothetical protein